jgi:prepilin-type N-terminal cleavage/methylation domain-containing protein
MHSRLSRPRTALLCVPPHARRQRGFSMAELLVTVVIAGVVFAAMVPFFANALSRTSEDEVRVDGNTIAQDRVEQVRLLDFSDITTTNLNTPTPTKSPFGDGRFGPTYTLYGEARPYTVKYEVTTPPTPTPTGTATADPSSTYKKLVIVTVSRDGSTYKTTAQTVVRDPAAGTTSIVDAEPTGLSLTLYFDTYSYVTGAWITRVQTNVTPNATTTPTPGVQVPNAGMQELTWSGLTGGPNYWYNIYVDSTKATYTMHPGAYHLWKSDRKKIDAYPGGD